MEAIIQLAFFLTLLTLGYFIGKRREKNHYLSIRKRERKTLHLPVHSDEKFSQNYSEVKLFTGSVVIAQDYFKLITSIIKNLFGGNIQAYETLLDRGRREAMLRLKEDALIWGAQEVANLKVETSSISNGKGKQAGTCEVMVYATAGKN